MEKTDRETHDFMNVESFSQLPFIRPSPPKEKGIRLFGKQFHGGGDSAAGESESTDTSAVVHDEPKESGESRRRFECHYCCRNFPTSQALGGHQNAHKRERQHEKRAHLHSAAMLHRNFSDAQIYGLVNYHRLATYQPPPAWGTTANAYGTTRITNNNSRFYGVSTSNCSSNQAPINGSPLLGLWKYPNIVQNSTAYNPDRSINTTPLLSTMGTGSASQKRYMYESKASVRDPQVSLDLHL